MSTIARLFAGIVICALAATGALAADWRAAQPFGRAPAGWQDDFNGSSLDTNRWVIMTGQAPGYIANNHIGFFYPDHVWLSDGHLVLRLDQQYGQVGTNLAGVISVGGGISSKQTYGYGTFEWTMQMSSTATSPSPPAISNSGLPVSGSVSAGFIYVNNSQTEIDFEFCGDDPNTLFATNWKTVNNSTSYLVPAFALSGETHTFKFVWSRKSISYYLDGVLKAVSTTNVPSAPAYFMISHWGSNNPWFGGLATVDVTRYFYIDHVSYTPQ